MVILEGVTNQFRGVVVKPEPLTLFPVLLLFLWLRRRSPRDFIKHAIVLGAATAAVFAPWTIRNYIVFDRIIPLSASGGISAHLVFYPGATGGQRTRANAEDAAFAECERRRQLRRLRVPCKLYALDEEIVWLQAED